MVGLPPGGNLSRGQDKLGHRYSAFEMFSWFHATVGKPGFCGISTFLVAFFIPRHRKYVEGYIVFVSIRSSVLP